MIVFDNHLHLQMHGENVLAVKRFERLGGTHINLTNVPNYSYPMDENYYLRIYEDTLKLANEVRKRTRVKVLVTVGPYPVDMVHLVENGWKIENAYEFLLKGLHLAYRYVVEGRADAIGEIGRPHFQVSEKIWERSNALMVEGMKLAKEAGCPVVLHTESATEKTWEDLARFASLAGLPKDMVIKHYSPPVVDRRNHGIFPSITASRKNVRDALSQGTRFLLETDFMDEPTRPNAVLPIESVPKRARWVVQEYGGEIWMQIMENATRIYTRNPEIWDE